MHRGLAVVFMMFFSSLTWGQSELVVMSYNVLNFPNGEIPNRQDTLKQIIDYVQPDLLLIQELKSESGLHDLAAQSFSGLSYTYEASTFVEQESNPDSGWPLQQAIIYNTDKIGLKSESHILTPVRDINEYKLFLEDPMLEKGADTTYFYVFVAHLKSSQGAENEALRELMAEDWRARIAEFDEDDFIILGGDFNLYSSDEDAYQLLLGEGEEIEMEDPIDSPGDWTESSFPDKEILTQSTRSSQIYGDGAGGGLDDRFDFVLLSSSLMNPDAPLHYLDDSYHALGNNGTCYNQDILDCIDGNEVPDHVITALYHMSDHLPIVLRLEADAALTTGNTHEESWFTPTLFSDQIIVSGLLPGAHEIEVYNALGQLIYWDSVVYDDPSISTTEWPNGLYIICVDGKSKRIWK